MTPFNRILVPHDFSEPATGALRFAAQIVPRDGRLLVLHVIVPFVPVTDVPPTGLGSYIAPGELVAGAQKQLERIVAKALPRNQAARAESKVVIGDPYQRIMAASRGMDGIVMSTAGRTGLSHLLIGSVTEKVVRHSLIPVITMRGKSARKDTKRKARR